MTVHHSNENSPYLVALPILSFPRCHFQPPPSIWFKTAKNQDVSTVQLASSLAPLTHLLALCCAHSFARSHTLELVGK